MDKAECKTNNPNRNPIPNNKPFGTEQAQPTPEAKKKGWERRRMAQQMMDLYEKYMNMNYAEFKAIKSDIKKNPEMYTVLEVDMFRYAKNPRFIIDRLDRHISKAPQQVEVANPPDESFRTTSALSPEERQKLADVVTEAFKSVLK